MRPAVETVDPVDLPLPHRLVLALLGANGQETVPRKLWLQKELFYLARDKPRMQQALEFAPYLQGPWSEASEQALEDLRALGLVDFDSTYGRHLRLTNQGVETYEEVAATMPPELADEIAEAKDLFNDLSENELLLFVYDTYPEMTTGSVVKDKITPRKAELARSLYRKGKVSLERAAELAGVPLRDFAAAAS